MDLYLLTVVVSPASASHQCVGSNSSRGINMPEYAMGRSDERYRLCVWARFRVDHFSMRWLYKAWVVWKCGEIPYLPRSCTAWKAVCFSFLKRFCLSEFYAEFWPKPSEMPIPYQNFVLFGISGRGIMQRFFVTRSSRHNFSFADVWRTYSYGLIDAQIKLKRLFYMIGLLCLPTWLPMHSLLSFFLPSFSSALIYFCCLYCFFRLASYLCK